MKTFFALTALALGMAAPAQAKVYVLTVTGVTQTHSAYVYDMADRLGLFGAPGGSMMGKAFTMTFRINTGQPWVQTTYNTTQSVWSSGINPYYQRGDAIVGSFTMAGKTLGGIGLSGPNPTNNGATAYGVGSESQLSVQAAVSNQSNDLFSIVARSSANYPGAPVQRWGRNFAGWNAAIGFSMDNAFGQNPRPDLYAGGGELIPFDAVALPGGIFGNGSFSVGGNGTAGSNYYLGIQRVTLAAAVPEPATWTLMIGGFGLVGGAIRRRVSAERPARAG